LIQEAFVRPSTAIGVCIRHSRERANFEAILETAPTFSVVIPVYNRAGSIGPTLQSVKDQTFADFECIVVDDGSMDGPELEAAVRRLDDQRFRYLRRENGGGGAARNTGTEAARGRLIAFLDSDDFFLPSKLQACRARMTDDPLHAVYSSCLVDRGVGRYWVRPSRAIRTHEDVGEYLFVSNQFIPTPTIVLHREIALTVAWDPALRKGQDLDFCLRLHRAGVRFHMVEEPLVIWNDFSEMGRASRTTGWQAPQAWLERSRPLLTKRAWRGYRANVLAYYMAGTKPALAARYLLSGWLLGHVPTLVIFRQTLRAYLPRNFYRTLVNRFVKARGTGVP
jgi:glycosyltransferase involved in cell wall biosynthesis